MRLISRRLSAATMACLQVFIGCSVLLIAIIGSPSTGSAATANCSEKKLRDLGVVIQNCSGSSGLSCSTNASAVTSGKVFMIGDSVTEGTKADLEEAFQSRGMLPVVDGLSGRRLSEGSDPLDGQSVLAGSTEEITGATAIVIALGTNGGVTAASVQKAVETVRALNKTARIFWVNIGVDNSKRSSPLPVTDWNRVLDDSSATVGFTVVDWAASIVQGTDIIADDGVGAHPTGGGRQLFASTVVGTVTGSTSSASGMGACGRLLPGRDNAERAYNYLVGKGLTPFQAAGLVGNLNSESRINPTTLQCIYSHESRNGVDPALLDESAGVRLSNYDEAVSQLLNRSRAGNNCGVGNAESFGWGIVQWTPSSKMIDPSRAAGRSDEEIESLAYQLDFLWSQLTDEDIGVTVPSEKTRAGDHLLRTTTVEEATISFAQNYERCSRCNELSHIQGRIDFAIDLLNRLGSSTR